MTSIGLHHVNSHRVINLGCVIRDPVVKEIESAGTSEINTVTYNILEPSYPSIRLSILEQ